MGSPGPVGPGDEAGEGKKDDDGVGNGRSRGHDPEGGSRKTTTSRKWQREAVGVGREVRVGGKGGAEQEGGRQQRVREGGEARAGRGKGGEKRGCREGRGTERWEEDGGGMGRLGNAPLFHTRSEKKG